jgi:archaellum biogenesis protein FlaJ (TadC family)
MQYFSGIAESYSPYLSDLKPDLSKANIKLSLKEYISIALMTITLVFIVEFPLLSFLTGLFPGFTIIMAFLFSFAMTIFFCSIIAFFFYVYPSMRVQSRAKKINYSLPFATTYLATVSGSNAPPSMMFNILSDFEEYQEIAKEAKRIRRDIELLGMTTIEALRKAAKQSPSEKLKELLWGINTTIRTGGDLTSFLHEKADTYMRDYRRALNQYSETLSTFLEIYLTLIIVSSIFFIIITTIISAFGVSQAMGSLIAVSQFAVVFLFLPVISIGFVYLLKQISPEG